MNLLCIYYVFKYNDNSNFIFPCTLPQAEITGRNMNPVTYLSAGDIPEPYLFFSVFVAYVLLSFVWLRVLRQAT